MFSALDDLDRERARDRMAGRKRNKRDKSGKEKYSGKRVIEIE